ncbi:MAG: SUMF1/EgtB/PvdO family nonheme iron enzyme [Treponema sp.]|nr:SUMF1/EgtB/PvdO family nonheme iron enzyme [Treponema sp.]
MMKKKCIELILLLLICLVICLAPGCKTAGSGGGAGLTLDEAIQIAAGDINTSLGESTIVAVINFSSPSENLSDYVVEELMGSLTNAKKLVVVDRSNLALVREEMNLQLSGEVSDESAQAIGRMLGAQGIITGSLVSLGREFRFRVYAINVESAARETATLLTVINDQRLSYLLQDAAGFSAAGTSTAGSSAQQGMEQQSSSQHVRVSPARPPARGTPIEMVRIEGGTFTMGSPETEPSRAGDEVQHQVTLSAFYIGKYEVTQEEYEAVTGTNPSHAKGARLPVEMVSWDDAIEYCNKRSEMEGLTPVYSRQGDAVFWNTRANGYRLPTEAEWEYACRAGTTGPFFTGDNITTHEANYNGRRPYNNNAQGISRNTTMPAGSFSPNAWGLYDMHGNVTEWVWDWYTDYNTAPQTDPQGSTAGRWNRKIARGGSWFESGAALRSAIRHRGEPFLRLDDLGFRVARSEL